MRAHYIYYLYLFRHNDNVLAKIFNEKNSNYFYVGLFSLC